MIVFKSCRIHDIPTAEEVYLNWYLILIYLFIFGFKIRLLHCFFIYLPTNYNSSKELFTTTKKKMEL